MDSSYLYDLLDKCLTDKEFRRLTLKIGFKSSMTDSSTQEVLQEVFKYLERFDNVSSNTI